MHVEQLIQEGAPAPLSNGKLLARPNLGMPKASPVCRYGAGPRAHPALSLS